MNPEEEKPVRTVECVWCGRNGYCSTADCPVCEGAGVVPVNQADARDDAAEARWEAERGK